MSRILVVDDERAICQAFRRLLEREGHTALVAASGEEALRLAGGASPDAAFVDVQLPGMSGLELLRRLRADHPTLPVVVMTAFGSVGTAMEAIRLGAFDYLGKPVDLPQIRLLLERALHRPQPVPAVAASASQDAEPQTLVGQSAVMQEVFKLMGLLADNDLTVLITGESGVGKEVVARTIHRNSARGDRAFTAVNCAAIPEQLLESELFGHETGAFTGASHRQLGRFESAGDGSLFLDEIAELPYAVQGKLLRVLQQRSFERVGSGEPIPLLARLIVATNRPLEEEVAAGRFREDLYHRLNLVTLRVPPLRRRGEDIVLLAQFFLQQAGKELRRRFDGLEREALERLRAYHWPGNVRELEHVIKRSALLAPGAVITTHDLELPSASDERLIPKERQAPLLDAAVRAALRQLLERAPADGTREQPFHYLVGVVEQALVAEALEMTGGNQVSASRLLGLNRTTLRKKLYSESTES